MPSDWTGVKKNKSERSETEACGDIYIVIAAMVFNLTGINPELYFYVNTAVLLGMFIFIVLPILILCVLCIVALFLVKEIDWKMRALLINIFAAEICTWLALMVFFLGFPSRASDMLAVDFSCHVAVSLLIMTTVLKFTSIALYAVMVYIFLKYGSKDLKWYVIVPCISILWIIALGVASLPYFPGFGIFNNNGFCEASSRSLTFRLLTLVTLVGIMLISLCVTITFSILTYCYIKNNTIQENAELKKAIAKNLLYLLIASVLSFIFNLGPSTFPIITRALEDRSIIAIILVHYVLRVFLNLPSAATPIVTIIILKPVCLAMKNMFTKICIAARRQRN